MGLLDDLKGNGKPNPNAIPIKNVKSETITERPDLFQFRSTDYKGGERLTYNEKRVNEIVKKWDSEKLDPIMAVADPDSEDQYIVIGGHHRMEAMRRLDIEEVPIRIVKGDIHDEDDRKRLKKLAITSNYLVSENNLREQADNAWELYTDMEMSTQEIKEELRLKSSTRAEKLLWIHEAGDGVIERVMLQPELEPAAVELGRARVKYGMPEETVGGLFSRWVAEYEATGKVPGQVSLRTQIDLLAAARGDRGDVAQQEGMLAGFGGDIVLSEFDKSRRELEQLHSKERKIGQRMTACERLAADLDLDLDELLEAADERRKSVRKEIEQEENLLLGRDIQPPDDFQAMDKDNDGIDDSVDPVVTAKDDSKGDDCPLEKDKAEEAPPEGFGTNLFGDLQELPKPESDEDEEEEAGESDEGGPSMAMFGDDDGLPQMEQSSPTGEDDVVDLDAEPIQVTAGSGDAGDDFAPESDNTPRVVEVNTDEMDDTPIEVDMDGMSPLAVAAIPDGIEVSMPEVSPMPEVMSAVEVSAPAARAPVSVKVSDDALDDLPPRAEPRAKKPKRIKQPKVSGRSAAISAAIAGATKQPKKRGKKGRHPFLSKAEARRR